MKQNPVAMEQQLKTLGLLNQIGREISSSLSASSIIDKAYEKLSAIMDTSMFSIGFHNTENNSIEFASSIVKGKRLPVHYVSLSNKNDLAVLCFLKQQEIIIRDFGQDLKKYFEHDVPFSPENPESAIFLPLMQKEKPVGVITVQSFEKNAYNDFQIGIFRILSNYCTLALQNIDTHWRLESAKDELKSVQDKLIIQSKLAGLGEITAGIAHEIQNPLNFVNNFSEVSNELLEEMKEELLKGEYSQAVAIFDDIKQNLEKIIAQGKRADSIVKGMLQHSRGIPGQKEPTDINALAEEYLRLAYHGLRAKDKSFNASLKTDFDENIGKIEVVPQDIGRVILNLLTNAFYAVNEKRKLLVQDYVPAVTIKTKRLKERVEIMVADNGNGIPQHVIDKIFQPFFSTKPSGQGTGLGLTLSYEIITKGHSGELKVDTQEGEGSAFFVYLPV
jgi:signal transduction histidine kinase